MTLKYYNWLGVDRDVEKLVKSCKSGALNQEAPSKVPARHWGEPQNNFNRIRID